MTFAHPGARVLTAGSEPALAVRVIPDLLDIPLVALEPELNHDIDEQIEQRLDVGARQFAARGTLLHQKHQLLKRGLAARSMHAGDRARVAGIDVAKVIKRLLGPKLRQEYPVGLHAKARLQKLL